MLIDIKWKKKFVAELDHNDCLKRTRVDKRVFWPQYFRKIEYVCLLGVTK